MFRFLCRALIGSALLITSAVAFGFDLDEHDAVPGEWGYRPDGGTAETNPPAFSWRPAKDARAYRLQITGGGASEAPVLELAGLRWAAACPARPLPPGDYQWRYAAQNEAGDWTAWSRVRSFTISGDTPEFPMPAIQDLIARIPEAHPRLFLRPEGLPALREAATGRLAERFLAIRKQADNLIASPPDCSPPPPYPPGTPPKGEVWKKIWWGNRDRSENAAGGAATLAFVYMITGEPAYAEAGKKMLLAIADWDPKGPTSYTYNDEAGMPLLYYVSRAYSWLYDQLTPEERARVIAAMGARGAEVYNRLRTHLWQPYESHRNRAWHFLGEVAVAFHGEIPEADEWLEYVMTIFYTAYPVWGGNDGGWHEGVGYWTSYIERFLFWAHIMRVTFGIEAFDKPYFHEAGYFPLYVTPPGTTAAGFGDMASTTTSSRSASLMAQLAAGARNPYWQWYADEHDTGLPGGYLGFFYAAQAAPVEAHAPEDLPASRVFPCVGIAALNVTLSDIDRNVQVLFKSAPFGRISHGYNANNAFVLQAGGKPVFIASGRRDVHGSPHHMEWMWETKSDNAILVNGKGQKKHSPEARGRIVEFSTSPEVDIVAGETQDTDSGLERWIRRITFLKPDILVIQDTLQAAEPSTFQWLLHAPAPFEIGGNALTWRGDPGVVHVQFLEPAGLDITQTDQFDTPPADWASFKLNEWHMTAATHEPTAQREFITVISIGETEVSAHIEGTGGSRAVQVTQGGRKRSAALP